MAPDSFKGSLTPTEVATALADGWRRARPTDELRLIRWLTAAREHWQPSGRQRRLVERRPPGILVVIDARFLARGDQAVSNWRWRRVCRVGRRRARRGRVRRSARAKCWPRRLNWCARSCWHRRQRDDRWRPWTARGTRRSIPAMLPATHWRAAARAADRLADLDGRRRCSRSRAHRRPTSPTRCGKAVRQPTVQGCRRGADPCPRHGARPLRRRSRGRLEARSARPGAAAGGTTAGLLAIADSFKSFVRPGVEIVMQLTSFDRRWRPPVSCSPARPDRRQTVRGDRAQGSPSARRAGVACISGGGARGAALAALGAVVVPVTERPMSLGDAMAGGAAPVIRAAERVARIINLASARIRT